MLGAPLHVEQRHAALAHEIDEGHQRDLRRVALVVEHRLAGEHAADPDAVESSRQLAVAVEDLDAVRPSEVVQPLVGGDEVVRDPAVLPRRIGAGADHPGEAVSTRTSNRRALCRIDRVTRRPSSGTMPRGSGDHQPITPGMPVTSIGKMPRR